jgi:hypothetical protein
MKEKPRRPPELNLLRACVLIVIAPLVVRGTSCGQDFDFHLQSWMEVARQWRLGVIYPHWVASANFGAGEPRFVFYPPLSWILGALLGTILPAWTWTPIAFIALCVLAMGISFYKMACEWMPPHSAEIAACLYTISPYIFFVVYERGALAELLAALWLPPLVLYALCPNRAPAQTGWLNRLQFTPQLALVVAALWLTNAPAAVMGSYMLAIIAPVAAISQRSWTLIIRAASAMALGLGLAAIYIIPAIYEQRWVQIARAVMPGMRIQDSFLFEHTGMAYHDQVLRTASWLAVILLLATAAAAFFSHIDRKSHPLFKPLAAVAIFITFLLFPISKFLWNAAPELRFLQFPWRWLLVLSLIFAAFAGLAISDPMPSRRGKILRAAAVLALAAIFCTHAWRHFWLLCDDEDNVTAQIATLNNQGFAGTDEYTPNGVDNGDIQQHLPPIRVLTAPDGDEADSSLEQNPEWNPDMDDLVPAIIQFRRADAQHITAEIQSPQPGYAVLRLLDYPAWQVRVNDKSIPRPTGVPELQAREWREARVPGRLVIRNDRLITVPIPAGNSTIDVEYIATPDIWAGRIVSVVSLIAFSALWFTLAAKSRRDRV